MACAERLGREPWAWKPRSSRKRRRDGPGAAGRALLPSSGRRPPRACVSPRSPAASPHHGATGAEPPRTCWAPAGPGQQTEVRVRRRARPRAGLRARAAAPGRMTGRASLGERRARRGPPGGACPGPPAVEAGGVGEGQEEDRGLCAPGTPGSQQGRRGCASLGSRALGSGKRTLGTCGH